MTAPANQHRKNVLFIGLMWPEPKATAAGSRMFQLLYFFLEQDYKISFACTLEQNEAALELERLNVSIEKIELNHPSFNALLKKLKPEMVVFDRFITEEQFGWRVAAELPNTIRILDTEDLHALRSARGEALRKKKAFKVEDWTGSAMAKREIASIYRCDCSLIISSFEMQLLQNVLKIPASLLFHLPFMLPTITEDDQKSWHSFEDRSDFICIGNGKHKPNIDAFLWLKKEIWPLIRKALPHAYLKIYGAYLPQKIKELHDEKTGFLVMGRAENAKLVLEKSRVNLAPLRFGAGLKGKLIDGFIVGTPNITTTIGAEGMHEGCEWGGIIADNADDFALSASKLYQHPELWKRSQLNGVTILNQCYSKTVLAEQLKTKFEMLYKELKKHRSNNFIGEMLQHHTMASTKYMAKWIEIKNKALKPDED